LYVNGGGGPYNFLNLDGDDTRYVWGNDGFTAANFARASNYTPEPTYLIALGLGLSGLALAKSRGLIAGR
jgi:hypothetical protein